MRKRLQTIMPQKTKADSIFEDVFSTTLVDNKQTPDISSRSKTRSSTQSPETHIRFANPPDVSHPKQTQLLWMISVHL